MLQFQNIGILNEHIKYLSSRLGTSNLFAVGGCVRDVLLGIIKKPEDVDVAMAGDPKDIFAKIDKESVSCFMTEKYGTITIIPKNVKEPIQYEITPFRTEGGYDDKRHPTEITWSNDILQDVERREFTMSGIYYFSIKKSFGKYKKKDIDLENVIKNLDKLGILFIKDYKLLIVQKTEIIAGLFDTGVLQRDFLKEILKTIEPDEDKISIDGILIDPAMGLQDIVHGKIRAIGEPDKRFNEDALRMIRGLRFISVLNTKLSKIAGNEIYFDMDKKTRQSIKKNFYQIQYIAKERIKIELDKVFKKGSPFCLISLLDEVNMLKHLFPALYATKNINQPIRYHPFDVYHHTILTLYSVERLSTNYLVRYAMLYHDVGKVDQYYLYGLGLDAEEIHKIDELNHRNLSGVIARRDFARLGFANKEIDELCRYIDNHHKPEEILAAKHDNQLKKLRKMLSESSLEQMNNLFDLVKGDRLGHYNPIQPPAIDEIDRLRSMLTKLEKEEGKFTIKELAIDGDEIIQEFDLKPGKKIGEILKKCFEWAINDIKDRNNKESILVYIKSLLDNTKK